MLSRYLGLIFMVVLNISCAKENYLPNIPVNFSSPITDPRISSLSAPNGFVSLTGYGIAGIIIYRRSDYSYVAFDRCSTVNPEEKNAVERMIRFSVVGSAKTIKSKLQSIVTDLKPDELIVTAQIFDHAARLRSFELLAEAWFS